MIKAWMAAWFPGAWRDKARRFRALGEYAALAGSQHLLADLAMRNFVFAPLEVPPGVAPNLFDLGVAEGRRRAVLELLELTRVNPQALAEIELQPPATRRDRT